jgi:LemA protein
MVIMKFRSLVFALMLGVSTVGATTSCSLIDKGVEKYDTLVNKDEICNQMWADYEAQLQRRADLIPNLVAVVKGSAAHEEKTLKEVMEARAAATQIKISGEDVTDPEKMAAFQKAQEQLKGTLSRLMMVQENYPDLKANAQFHDLMVQMEGTENRILRARQQYNKTVQDYNLELRRISGKAINPLTGHEFKPRIYFSADESAKTAPKVDFSTPSNSGK